MKPREKTFVLVLDLLHEGCATSRDIAEAFPMPLALASAHLAELGRLGLARKTGRTMRPPRPGRALNVWEPREDRA